MSTDIKRFVGEGLQLVQKFENFDKALAVALEKVQADRKEYPMLFSTSMVKAILAGRKTQTRRLRNLEQFNSNPDKWKYACAVKYDPIYHLFEDADGGVEDADGDVIEVKCPFGKPGDILWVRETWLKLDRDHVINSEYVYKADGDPDTENIRREYINAGRAYNWKPSIHMPKEACRLRLEITAIRVERLNDISEGDAVTEGIEALNLYSFPIYRDYLNEVDGYQSPFYSFKSLWQSINGTGSWYANPWVWVIEFKIQNL